METCPTQPFYLAHHESIVATSQSIVLKRKGVAPVVQIIIVPHAKGIVADASKKDVTLTCSVGDLNAHETLGRHGDKFTIQISSSLTIFPLVGVEIKSGVKKVTGLLRGMIHGQGKQGVGWHEPIALENAIVL